jgi:PIN domain nuclease of toxin-antitoxin system
VALLLDTHALIWALSAPARLSTRVLALLDDVDVRVVVSAVSPWEIAIKQKRGKLEVPADLVQQLAASAFEPLDITATHGIAAGSLPLHHRDPFDRMLVAQAQLEQLTLVTSDPRLRAYDVALLNASPSASERSA